MYIALAQVTIIWEDKDKNFEKIRQCVKSAKENKASIIFFPEMSLTGFSMNVVKTAEYGMETVNKIKKLALEYNIAIGIGWTKGTSGKAENHYTIMTKSGEIISDYTKIHPFSYAKENEYFQGGNDIHVFEYENHTWSSFICYDLRFPEIFQIASEKAEIIVVPANWPKKRDMHWRTLLRARAIENQSYIIGVNCVGNIGNIEYSGYSTVISPNGDILTELGNQEGIIYAEIGNEVIEARQNFSVKKDRRKDMYS